MLTKINQLPVTDHWNKVVASDAELSEIVKEAQISLKVLLNDLCYLDTLLAKVSVFSLVLRCVYHCKLIFSRMRKNKLII